MTQFSKDWIKPDYTLKQVSGKSYNIMPCDDIVHVTGTKSNRVRLILPITIPAINTWIIIKDAGFNAHKNIITIKTKKGFFIENNQKSISIRKDGGSIWLYAFENNWYVNTIFDLSK